MRILRVVVCSIFIIAIVLWAQTNNIIPHSDQHKDSGFDEVATATPGANAIVKSQAGGDIAEGWIPTSLIQAYTIESGATPLTLKRTGLTVIFTLQSTSVGDTIIDFKNDGQQTYRVLSDRIANSFVIENFNTGRTFLEYFSTSEDLTISGDVILFEAGGASEVMFEIQPTSSITTRCIDTTPTTGDTLCIDKAGAGESGNLREWQNNTGTVLSEVTASGIFVPPQSATEPENCVSGIYGAQYYDTNDNELCTCRADGTDDEWVKATDPTHTGHCTI